MGYQASAWGQFITRLLRPMIHEWLNDLINCMRIDSLNQRPAEAHESSWAGEDLLIGRLHFLICSFAKAWIVLFVSVFQKARITISPLRVSSWTFMILFLESSSGTPVFCGHYDVHRQPFCYCSWSRSTPGVLVVEGRPALWPHSRKTSVWGTTHHSAQAFYGPAYLLLVDSL